MDSLAVFLQVMGALIFCFSMLSIIIEGRDGLLWCVLGLIVSAALFGGALTVARAPTPNPPSPTPKPQRTLPESCGCPCACPQCDTRHATP